MFTKWVEQFFSTSELKRLYRVVNNCSVAPQKLFSRYCRLEQIYLCGMLQISRQKAVSLLGHKYQTLKKVGRVVLSSGAIASYRNGEIYLTSQGKDWSDITCYA